MALTNEDLLAISDLLKIQLKSELEPIRIDIEEMKNDIQTVRAELQTVKTEVNMINLRLENTIEPQIQLLAENYVPAAKKYEKAVCQIESMQADIDILKTVVTEHSEKLQRIS